MARLVAGIGGFKNIFGVWLFECTRTCIGIWLCFEKVYGEAREKLRLECVYMCDCSYIWAVGDFNVLLLFLTGRRMTHFPHVRFEKINVLESLFTYVHVYSVRRIQKQ